MSGYLFDNAAPQTAQRFDSLETLYDPSTLRHLEALGVSTGWQCLEVGGGGGSIAEWLAERVLALLSDPTFAVSSMMLFSAWGRYPNP